MLSISLPFCVKSIVHLRRDSTRSRVKDIASHLVGQCDMAFSLPSDVVIRRHNDVITTTSSSSSSSSNTPRRLLGLLTYSLASSEHKYKYTEKLLNEPRGVSVQHITTQELIRRWDSGRELLRSSPGSYPNSLK